MSGRPPGPRRAPVPIPPADVAQLGRAFGRLCLAPVSVGSSYDPVVISWLRRLPSRRRRPSTRLAGSWADRAGLVLVLMGMVHLLTAAYLAAVAHGNDRGFSDPYWQGASILLGVGLGAAGLGVGYLGIALALRAERRAGDELADMRAELARLRRAVAASRRRH